MAGETTIMLTDEQKKAIAASPASIYYMVALADDPALVKDIYNRMNSKQRQTYDEQMRVMGFPSQAAIKNFALSQGAKMVQNLQAGGQVYQELPDEYTLNNTPAPSPSPTPRPSGVPGPSQPPTGGTTITFDQALEQPAGPTPNAAPPVQPADADTQTAAPTTQGATQLTQQQVEANTRQNMAIPNMGKPRVFEKDGKQYVEFTQEQLAFYTDHINKNAERAKITNPEYNPYLNPNADPLKMGLDRLRGPMDLSYGQVDPNTHQPRTLTLADLGGVNGQMPQNIVIKK